MPNNYLYPQYGYYGGLPNQYPAPQSSAVPQQPQQTGLMTIFVDSEEAANNYPVAAGLTVMLMNFDGKKFYLKSRSTNGVPQPLRVFTFSEDSAVAPQNQNGSSGVTREEFNDLREKLGKLITELGGDK